MHLLEGIDKKRPSRTPWLTGVKKRHHHAHTRVNFKELKCYEYRNTKQYQNPNPKKNAFDIEAFEFDLTFGLCNLTFSLSLHFWKFNMNIIPRLKWNGLEGRV